jgi:hypothetical protein
MSTSFSTLVMVLGPIEFHSGAVDPTVGGGIVAPIGSEYWRSDATQWIKTGAGNTAWTSNTNLIGSPQRFQYTVTGVEPDLTALVIALPAARATATYEVYISQEQATNILGPAVLTASKTTAQFVLQLTGAATAGDIFNFLVVDRT